MVVSSESERLPSMALLGAVMICLSCVEPSTSFKNTIERFTPIEEDYYSTINLPVTFGILRNQSYLALDTTADFTWLKCSNNPDYKTYHTWESTTHNNVSCESEKCHDFYRNKQQKKPPCLPDNLCRYNFTYKNEDLFTIPMNESFMSGWLITDVLGFPLANAVWNITDFIFVCVDHRHGGGSIRSDGRIGLARGEFSLMSQMNQILKQQQSDGSFHEAFQIHQCQGGFFTAGRNKDPDNTGTVKMLQSKFKSRESYYYIDMKNISVAGNQVVKGKAAQQLLLSASDGHGGVVMDSNLYFTRLAPEVYVAVRDAFRKEISGLHNMTARSDGRDLFDTCYEFPEAVNQSYRIPSVSFNFDEFDLTLSQIQTLHFNQTTSGFACLAFLRSDKDFSTLGVYQLRDMYVNYDVGAEKVKLSPNQCNDNDDTSNGSSFPYFPPYFLLLGFVEYYVFHQMYIP